MNLISRVNAPATPPPSPASQSSPKQRANVCEQLVSASAAASNPDGRDSYQTPSYIAADEFDELHLDELPRIDIVKRLPIEISTEILLLLPAASISASGLVSHTWRTIARTELLWKRVCSREWNSKQFHPLELHPLVDWSRFENLSLPETIQILTRRGVEIRAPTKLEPPSASWPSATFPVRLSSWSWTHWRPQNDDSETGVPDEDDDDFAYDGNEVDANFPSARDMPWLKRLMGVTLPTHAPASIPTSCGKWMASYVAAEKDRSRTLITCSELTEIQWRFETGPSVGVATFSPHGLWISDIWPHHEWWRIRHDGRPQVNFYAPLTVRRRDGEHDTVNDWGWVMFNDFCVFVSKDRDPPPFSLGMTSGGNVGTFH